MRICQTNKEKQKRYACADRIVGHLIAGPGFGDQIKISHDILLRALVYARARALCCWVSGCDVDSQVAQPMQIAIATVSSSTKPEKEIQFI